MRTLLVLFLIFGCIHCVSAQDSMQVETPKIISKLKVGNTVKFNSKSIKFIKVLEDSRCPSDVDCMWAGEIKISLGIYDKNILIEEKEFVFGAQAINPENTTVLLKTDKKTILGYTVSPYPSSDKPINPTAYYLEFLMK